MTGQYTKAVTAEKIFNNGVGMKSIHTSDLIAL
jgi:hypothetical protein